MMTPALKHLARALSLSLAGPALTVFPVVNQSFAVDVIPSAAASQIDAWSYADVADVFAAAPVAARVRIAEAIVVKGAPTRPGTIRVYLQGDIISLIRAPGALPPRLAWLADVPLDARGRAPKLRKATMLLAARPVPGRAAELQLVARDGMVIWTPAVEARVRGLVTEASSADAIPPVSGITGAFHSAGTIPGEGETQVFMGTRSGTAMSISVLRRPGEATRWSFAPGEIVDEAAAIPARDTLAWYRLACFLPRALPAPTTSELAAADAEAARADFAYVIEQLGPCPRNRT